MLKLDTGAKYSGIFDVDEKKIAGELTFAGHESNLLLHHTNSFNPMNVENECILGTLRDLTRVSLLKCIIPQVTASNFVRDAGRYETAKIIPHFILHGNRHVKYSDRKIRSVHVMLSDAQFIFPDYKNFSTAIRVTPVLLRSILKEKEKIIKTRTKIGKHPIVSYFTGNQSIFKVKTVTGTISAFHMPAYGFGGPSGVSITNKIGLKIKFLKHLTFSEAINKLMRVIAFFEIIVGRRQELATLSVELNDRDKSSSIAEVYWCNPPRREHHENDAPHNVDLPIDAVLEPVVFGRVLANWLERDELWREARYRFSTSFTKENFYDIDRLIGSANMFDLLPKSAVPQSITLSNELQIAKGAAKEAFKALSESAERSSILNALGRLGHASLKRKVRHRAEMVVSALGIETFPNLFEVLDLAIDARNHFVHGTNSDINYADNFFETVVFFSKSLEFVFLVSDLLDAGWDTDRWLQRGSTLSHPLGSFLHNYTFLLTNFRKVLPVDHNLKVDSYSTAVT